jgi:hypothetical protein
LLREALKSSEADFFTGETEGHKDLERPEHSSAFLPLQNSRDRINARRFNQRLLRAFETLHSPIDPLVQRIGINRRYHIVRRRRVSRSQVCGTRVKNPSVASGHPFSGYTLTSAAVPLALSFLFYEHAEKLKALLRLDESSKRRGELDLDGAARPSAADILLHPPEFFGGRPLSLAWLWVSAARW